MTIIKKEGWKTTEFWVLVASSLIAIFNEAFGWEIPKETIMTVFSGVIAYIVGRSVAKAKEAPAKTEVKVETENVGSNTRSNQ